MKLAEIMKKALFGQFPITLFFAFFPITQSPNHSLFNELKYSGLW
ncbi:MAG: hypothetical protein SOY63_08765 [Alloprevotella sp.]|nr:hypothetical protein [Alloprevotella sp.]